MEAASLWCYSVTRGLLYLVYVNRCRRISFAKVPRANTIEPNNEVSFRLGRLLQAPQECVLIDEAEGEEEERASFWPLGTGYRSKTASNQQFHQPPIH